MPRRFWTADLHLGHANIARYVHRPWLKEGDLLADGQWASEGTRNACAQRMNEGLIRNMNSRIKPGDTCVHVGDFCCRGAERQIPGTRTKARSWEEQLIGKWIFMEGNHDHNNGLRRSFSSAVVQLGPYQAGVAHIPVYDTSLLWPWPCALDFIICGHVHDKWGEQMIGGLLHINVGVDVRNYFPVRDDELIEIANRYLKGERKACK